jgi:arginase
VIDASNSNLAKKIAVLGAPIDIGASQRGTLMGPAALRTAGLLTLLDGLGFEVSDYGDLSIGDVADLADAPPDNAKHYREIQRWTRALSARAHELAQSAIPIFLGGDHTQSMGSVNGIARHWHAAGRGFCGVAGCPCRTTPRDDPVRQHAQDVGGIPGSGTRARTGLLWGMSRAQRRSAGAIRRAFDRQTEGSAAQPPHQRRRMRQIDEFGGVLSAASSTGETRNGGCTSVSTLIFLDPSVHPASAPRCQRRDLSGRIW